MDENAEKIIEIKLEYSNNTLELGSDSSEEEIFSKKNNRVKIGLPYCKIISNDKKFKPTEEITQRFSNYDILFLSMSCSFLPDRNCTFTWARFSIHLKSFSNDEIGNETEQKPFIFDLFPREITTKIEKEESITIAPDITFNLGKISIENKLIEMNRRNKWLKYEPTLFSFGCRTYSEFTWELKSTKEQCIFGDKTNLYAIVGIPKGSILKGDFKIMAEIKSEGIIGTFFSRKEKETIGSTFILHQ